MSGWSADALRNRAAGQRRIKHYCSCGRMFVGNAAWASHKRAHEGATYPAHTDLSGCQTRKLEPPQPEPIHERADYGS